MKLAWFFRSRRLGDFSTACIVSLTPAQGDDPNTHPRLGKVQENQLDLPQTMPNFPVIR